MKYLKLLVKKILINSSGAGSTPRSHGLKKDDVILVSYPKSGNTWLRMIVAHLLYPNRRLDSLSDLNWIVPDIYWGIPRWTHYLSPRVIKTHQPFCFRHEASNHSLYQKNIYIVRHPLDVALSFFDFQLKLWPNPETSFDQFVKKFAQGGLPGNSSWQEHVLSWKAVEYDRSIFFLRYEDLLEFPAKGIFDIASFLNSNVEYQTCEKIAEQTSKSAMKKKELRSSVVSGSYNFVNEGNERCISRDKVSDKAKAVISKYSAIAMNLFDYKMLG